jgi:hypothetical protein
MKFGKEEIQKTVLGVLLAVGIIYGYFAWLLFPLRERHTNTQKSIAALDPETARAKSQLARDADVRKQAPIAQDTLAQIDRMIPEGAPVAWFPTRIGDFFRNRGIDKVTTRLTVETAHPSLAGYRRIIWSVELPKVDCVSFAAAVAALENAEPLVSIENISIEAQHDEPDTQRVLLTLNNIVKQQ